MQTPDWSRTQALHDAERYSQLCNAVEAQANAEADMAERFAHAAAQGDANALCPWAPTVLDEEARQAQGLSWSAPRLPRRAQTLAEAMAESLDYGTGPSQTEAMHLILCAAKSTDATVATMAADLLRRMGAAFARFNAEVAS